MLVVVGVVVVDYLVAGRFADDGPDFASDLDDLGLGVCLPSGHVRKGDGTPGHEQDGGSRS